EGYACADVGRGVNGLCASLEQGAAGFDGEVYHGVHGKGIHHIEVATVQGEFADARRNANLKIFFGEFGTGEKEISRRPALFLTHDWAPSEGLCAAALRSRPLYHQRVDRNRSGISRRRLTI